MPKAPRTANKNLGQRRRQPLSAYNLFFRHERRRLILLFQAGKSIDDHPPCNITAEELYDFVEKNPVQSPREKKKRVHQKTHGLVSFTELVRTVSQRWKSLDYDVKRVFNEVSNQLRLEHYRMLEEERKRKKQADLTDSSGKASEESIAQDAIQHEESLPSAPARGQSKFNSSISGYGVTCGEAEPKADKQGTMAPPLILVPKRVSLTEESTIEENRSHKEVPAAQVNKAHDVEPVPLDKGAFEFSSSLDMEFSGLWLASSSSQIMGCPSTESGKHPTPHFYGIHGLCPSSPVPSVAALSTDEMSFMSELDFTRME